MNVYVSDVGYLITQSRQGLVQTRYSDHRRTHIYASAPGPQVHWHTDDPCFSVHSFPTSSRLATPVGAALLQSVARFGSNPQVFSRIRLQVGPFHFHIPQVRAARRT